MNDKNNLNTGRAEGLAEIIVKAQQGNRTSMGIVVITSISAILAGITYRHVIVSIIVVAVIIIGLVIAGLYACLD